MSLSVVDDNGELEFFSQPNLFSKPLQLDIPGREISKEVEANLTIGLYLSIAAEFL